MSVYVNICEWDRLPEPKSDEDPIPCVGGPLYELTDEQGRYILSNKKRDCNIIIYTGATQHTLEMM